MATTEQHPRHSSTRAATEAERIDVPAWPSRDLERQAARAAEQAAAAAGAPESAATPAAPAEPELPAQGPTAPPTDRPAPARAASFLADLTRAMRAAAEAERAEVLARLHEDAEAFVAQMRTEFAAATEARRERADQDVAALEAWCTAELERIRRQAEADIAERRARLDAELEAQGARLEEGVTRVGATVAEFEQAMASFFERLLAEEDPSTFGVMARNLPEAPAFEAWPPESAPAAEAALHHDADNAARAEEPADEAPELDPDALAAAEAEAAAALAAEGLADGGTVPATTPPMPVQAAAGAQAAGAASRQTRFVVAAIGLVSVASVSSFKRALAQLDGVRSVQVSSGPQGEFLFTLTADGAADLVAGVRSLPGFEVEVRGSGSDGVSVVAHDLDTEA